MNRDVRQLATVSIVDALEEDLLRRILDGDFTPGEHLRETELAQEYQVGRHTLRAAFDALVRRGVLAKERNRGVFVRVLTAEDLVEIYELRSALEAQAFRALAVRRAVPADARAALARLRKLSARSPYRLVVEADLAFHRAIVVAAGNARLARAHEDLQPEIVLCLAQLVRGHGSVQEKASEHAELVAAIESGRPVAAERAIREHLERSTAWLLERAVERDAVAAATD
jgi:DNA-binding GntR family transcriptional regulator